MAGTHGVTTITLTKARERLGKILDRAALRKERVVVKRRGKALAAIISIADLEWLEALEDRQDTLDARNALEEAKREGTIPWQLLRSELDLE